jgi:hypothetical protein
MANLSIQCRSRWLLMEILMILGLVIEVAGNISAQSVTVQTALEFK